jgi:uracil-DNA glycosylase
MCWKCGEAAHAPIACDDRERWRKLVNEVISCPKCYLRVERRKLVNEVTDF